MTKFTSIIIGSSAVTVLGIVASVPMVIVAGTLVACGTLLLALLSYFEAAH